jgi:hypothetical protein
LGLTAAAPQNSSDLRTHYGQPDVERFAMRPDITLTAQYGPDGKACILLIEPRHAFIHAFFMQPMPTISEDTANELLNEIAPPETRGRALGGFGVTTGTEFDISEYENLETVLILIIRLTGPANMKKALIAEAQVRYKRPGCESSIGAAAGSLKEASRPPASGQAGSPTGHSASPRESQTPAEFRARYGQPDVERFHVRWGLDVVAEYGADGQACKMRIEPDYGLFRSSPDDPAPPDKVADVLNEVVPPDTRGTELGPGEKIKGAYSGAAPPTEYENVTIIPYYGASARILINRGVDVLFKRDDCARLPKYSDK